MIQRSNQAKGSIFTLVVLQELYTRSYIGCPNDSKKIPDAKEGKEAVCPKCGQIVKPKALQWALFLVGDDTDEIIASFPPSIMNRPTEKMVIVAQGLLGENEELLVYRWSLPSELTKTVAPSQALPTFFKPVGESSPQSSPITVPKQSTTVPSNQNAAVIEPDSAPAAPTATPLPTTVPPTVPTSTPTTAPTVPTSTPLMCNQCNAGPFPNELALVGHKTTVHAKKTRRLKKPTVELGITPTVTTPAAAVPTTAPTPIPFTASPEQATLPITPDVEDRSIFRSEELLEPAQFRYLLFDDWAP